LKPGVANCAGSFATAHRVKELLMIIADAVEKLRSITPLPTQEEVTHFSPSLRSLGKDFEKFKDLIQQYDQKRYGMPLLELQEIVHSDALQRQFPERFGISFAEYAQRFL
jgi:hypothetical protein